MSKKTFYILSIFTIKLILFSTPYISAQPLLNIAYVAEKPCAHNEIQSCPGDIVILDYLNRSEIFIEIEGILEPSTLNWSPSNDQIAFLYSTGQNFDINVITLANGEVENLTNSFWSEGLPVWSPDGTQIAFIYGSSSISRDIFLFSLDTGKRIRVSHDVYASDPLAWSPDGESIAFTSVFDTNDINAIDISLIRLPETALFNITANNFLEHSPIWSPDGTRIAFISRRTGRDQIYTTDSEGTDN